MSSRVPTEGPDPTAGSSGTGRHGQDVGQMDEPQGRRGHDRCLALVLGSGSRRHRSRAAVEQLADLLELARVAVALVAR